MKKTLSMLLLLAAISTTFSACSDDDDFKYPMESVYGTWVGTELSDESATLDLTNFVNYYFRFSITFYRGGRYYGSGYFGNGSGTYKAKGNMIYTYVDGEEYARYKVESMTNDRASLTMTIGKKKYRIKVKKDN